MADKLTAIGNGSAPEARRLTLHRADLFALLDRTVTAFAPQREDAAGETVEERLGRIERVTELRAETPVAGRGPPEAPAPGRPPYPHADYLRAARNRSRGRTSSHALHDQTR